MFVQIIEGNTKDIVGFMRQGERWQSEVQPGAIGFLGVTAGTTADGQTITIARFESQDAASANSTRPEQSAWWAEMSKCYDGEPTFTESSDVEELLGGGSNDAGFVQIMKSRGVDRARMTELDAAFDKFSSLRPDLLGSVRIWTGAESCVEVNYFTSEAEARVGEKKEMPADVQAMMVEFTDVMKDTEFLDLTNLLLR